MKFMAGVLSIFLVFAMGVNVTAASTGSVRAFNIVGNATLKNESTGKITPLQLGQAFGQGSTVITGKKSSVLLAFSNGSVVNLDENSSLAVSEFLQESFDKSKGTYLDLDGDPSKSKTELQLNYGELAFDVKKLSKESTFNINTEVGSAGIRGTKGSVSVTKTGNTYKIKVVNKSGKVSWLKRVNGKLQLDTKIPPGRKVAGNLKKNQGVQGKVSSGKATAADIRKVKKAVEELNIPKEVKDFVKAAVDYEEAKDNNDSDQKETAEKALKKAAEKLDELKNPKKKKVELKKSKSGKTGDYDFVGAEDTGKKKVKDIIKNQSEIKPDKSNTYP